MMENLIKNESDDICENKCLGCCVAQYGNDGKDYRKIQECSSGECIPVKCPNYEICRRIDPMMYQKCWGGRCLTCDMTFGRNLIKDNQESECPVCFDTKILYLLDCNHKFCSSCINKIYLDSIAPNKYYDNTVLTNNQEEDDTNDYVEEVDNKEYFSKCPLCRKTYSPAWKDKLF